MHETIAPGRSVPPPSQATRPEGSGVPSAPLTGRVWAALAALLALAAGLRLIGLGRQSLWIDEAFSLNYAKPHDTLRAIDLLDNLHGPLHTFVLHHWIGIAGASEAMLRLPSVVAALLAIPALWFFARQAWGARIAWISAALLAISPFHVWYAQEARNYAFLILFAILAEWAFHRLIHRGARPALLAGYGLALLGGFLSNLSMAFLLCAQAARLLADRIVAARARPRDKALPGARAAPGAWGRLVPRVVLVWALVAACLSPWAVRFYDNQIRPSALLTTAEVPTEEKLRQETTDSVLGLPYTFYAFATGYSFGPSRREMWIEGPTQAARRHAVEIAIATLVFGFLWLNGFARCLRERPRDGWWLLLAHLVPLALLLFIASRNVKVINPRYVSVAFPAFVVTIAWGVSRAKAARLAGIAALVLSLVSLGRAYALETYHKEDYRSAAAWLTGELRPGDAFLSLAVDRPLRAYYLRDVLGDPPPGGPPPAGPPPEWEDLGTLIDYHGPFVIGRRKGRYAEIVLPSWTPGRRLFVLLAREWTPDPDGAVEADLRRRGRLIEERRWTGVRVLVLVREPEDGAGSGR